jgi:hypothetical protein
VSPHRTDPRVRAGAGGARRRAGCWRHRRAYGEEARIGPQVVEVCRPGAFAGTHPGDLPLLALPLVAVSPARWATPPGRTCATVSRASTSERATTPGLPFPRVVGSDRAGCARPTWSPGRWRPTKVLGGPHPHPPTHTKERQRRHRRYGPAMACAAKAEQWKDDSRVEGHRRFVCASGGWRNPMALLVAARVVCRSGCRTIRRTRWSLGDSASFRQPCMRTKVPSRDWRTCTRAPTNRVGSIEAA